MSQHTPNRLIDTEFVAAIGALDTRSCSLSVWTIDKASQSSHSRYGLKFSGDRASGPSKAALYLGANRRVAVTGPFL